MITKQFLKESELENLDSFFKTVIQHLEKEQPEELSVLKKLKLCSVKQLHEFIEFLEAYKENPPLFIKLKKLAIELIENKL